MNRHQNRSLTPRGRSEARVSLGDDYDGRRVVNTPLSIHACQLEGVDPQSLTINGRANTASNIDDEDLSFSGSKSNKNNSSSRKPRPSSPRSSSLQNIGSTAKGEGDAVFDIAVPLSKEQQEIKNRFLERRRQLLLASVLRTYKKLTSPRNTLPPPPLALTGELPDDVDDTVRGGGSLAPGSARRKKFASQPKSVTSTLRRLAAEGQQSQQDQDDMMDGTNNSSMKTLSLSNATVLSEENSFEVARYYSKLEHNTKKQWEANLKTELRDKEARQHWSDQVRERRESMSARGKKRDEHLHSVQEHHTELNESRRREIEERMKREQQRMDSVLDRKRQAQDEARERGKTRGESQRFNAMKSEQNRLDKIAEKGQEKADVQAEAAARRFQEKQLHDFEAQLNGLLSRDTQLRASRANEYKKEVFNERVQVSNYRATKRKEENNERFHDAMVQRDAVHRMKEQLDTFFTSLPKRPAEVTARYSTKGEIGGDLKILPPPALSSPRNRNNNHDRYSSETPTKPKTTAALLNSTSSKSVSSDVLPQIEPPTWLAKEVQHLTASQKVQLQRKRQRLQATSARSIIIKNNQNDADEDENNNNNSLNNSNNNRSSSARSVKRATHPRRWPFTAPESSATKVAYPGWMYQND